MSVARRILPYFLLAVPFACFSPEDDAPIDTDDPTSSTGDGTGPTATTVSTSVTMSTSATTMSTTDPDSSTTGPPTGSTTQGCPPGEEGCDCDADSCDGDLTCIDGTCSDCGNDTVEFNEECDGNVDGGTCESCIVVCSEGFGDCNDDVSDGCEEDLAATQAHCGACGHDCLGGDCTDSACEPVTLAQSQNQPLGIVTDGVDVFWVNDSTTGTVNSHSVDAGGAPTEIVGGLAFPERAAIDGSKIYWGNFNSTELGRANYDGTSLEFDFLDGLATTRRLVLSATEVYWVQFSGPGGVYRSTKVNPSADLITAEVTPVGLFLDGNFLYWTSRDDGAIRRTDLTVEPFVVEELVTGQPGPYSVVVANDVLYWVNEGVTPNFVGDVRSRDVDGGVTTIYAEGRPRPRELTVDDDHVYWVERDAAGSVQRADLATDEVEVLVPDTFSAGITHDDVAIYWTEQTAGLVRKLAK